MKKILCMLLAVLMLASLGSTAFADGWKEVYAIDYTIVEEAAQYIDSAKAFLECL